MAVLNASPNNIYDILIDFYSLILGEFYFSFIACKNYGPVLFSGPHYAMKKNCSTSKSFYRGKWSGNSVVVTLNSRTFDWGSNLSNCN